MNATLIICKPYTYPYTIQIHSGTQIHKRTPLLDTYVFLTSSLRFFDTRKRQFLKVFCNSSSLVGPNFSTQSDPTSHTMSRTNFSTPCRTQLLNTIVGPNSNKSDPNLPCRTQLSPMCRTNFSHHGRTHFNTMSNSVFNTLMK